MTEHSHLPKRLSFLVFLLLSAEVLCAQISVSNLLKDYVASSVNGESTIAYVTKINQLFRSYSKEQQQTFVDNIYRRIEVDNDVERQDLNTLKEQLALIDLYMMTAEGSDPRLDRLYYYKGEIGALCLGDTIMIKECITSLRLSDRSSQEPVAGYIQTLKDYLEQIRAYIPPSQQLDGVWVSDVIWTFQNLPAYVLIVENGKVKLDIVGYGADCLAKMSTWGNLKDDGPTYAQSIEDLDADGKVYMAWSNEKLHIPNQRVAQGLSSAAGDVATSAIEQGMSQLVGEFGGELFGGIAGGIISDAVSSLFAPSKKIHVLEMEVQKENNYELTASVRRKLIKIGSNNVPTTEESTQTVRFMRYSPQSGVFFNDVLNFSKYVPGMGRSKKLPENCPEVATAMAKYQQNTKVQSFSMPAYDGFNELQTKKLRYFNDQQMTAEGIVAPPLTHEIINRPYLGIMFEPEGKSKKLEQGVRIYDVDGASPAYYFGIRSEDILLAFKGQPMSNPQQFLDAVATCHPCEWVPLLIKRGKKEREILVELTWR